MDKWRLLGAGVVVGALLLCAAACTPGGEPVVTESPSGGSSPIATTPVASPSPTPTGTDALLAQLPDGATSPGLDGAIVTAEFFLTLYAPMFHTGDTAMWEFLSGEECSYCSSSLDNVKTVQDRGWAASGGEIAPEVGASRAIFGDDDRAYVDVPSHLNDAVLIKDAGTPELAEAASDTTFTLQLEFRDGKWLVQGVKFA
ncbi:DUF6318 family protein [Demequina sp.]|uniref:DUF6318 family protein n=1 Tax=Demequina sp. TaxID=2050685 RepID=UPI003D0A1FFD